ncbi:MAG: FAD-binding protein [Patescibacteria group bacterium]|nr:FAD-binding protein [Patescibacteria group bacterium]
MEDRIRLLVKTFGDDRVKTNVDLSEYLQTGLGGPVKAFYIATTTRELIRVIEICKDLKLDFLVVGSGSKIALSQHGQDIIAIKNRSDSIRIFGIKGKVSRDGLGIEEAFLEVDSGVTLDRLAENSFKQGLGGFEILRSTLGTVGGSFYVLPILREKAHQVKVLTPECEILVKESIRVAKEDIILSVVFKLKSRK